MFFLLSFFGIKKICYLCSVDSRESTILELNAPHVLPYLSVSMSTYIHTAHILNTAEKQQVVNLIMDNNIREANRKAKELYDERVIGLRSCGWQFLFNENDDLYDHNFVSFNNYLMRDDVELLLWDPDDNGEYKKVSKEDFLEYINTAKSRRTQLEYGGYRTVDGFNFSSHDMSKDDIFKFF